MNVLILGISALLWPSNPGSASDPESRLPKHGTAVEWEPSIEKASDRAREEGRLLMILHLSGELPDPDLTWNNAQALRSGALSDPKVGAYLSRHYRAAWKKIGTFTVLKFDGRIVGKRGGNVAAYFCTPDGVVLGAVMGNSDPAFFLEEAKWAAGLAARLKEAGEAGRRKAAWRAHALRAESAVLGLDKHRSWTWQGSTARANGVTVHQKLFQEPLAKVERVYGYFFEKVLGEKVSDEPVRVNPHWVITRWSK